MNIHSQEIINKLQARHNSAKAKWLENYVKYNIKSLGLGIPEIRTVMQDFERSTGLSTQKTSYQVAFLNDLMKNEYTEPKLAAILFVQLYWKADKIRDTLKLISQWFDQSWISDWNVCDWLCVRILTPLLDIDPKTTITVLIQWNKSPNLWKARASLVPFAQAKTISQHTRTIAFLGEVLIKRDERFCKTAVGWVLREASKTDQNMVKEFVEKYRQYFSKESMANALKYLV